MTVQFVVRNVEQVKDDSGIAKRETVWMDTVDGDPSGTVELVIRDATDRGRFMKGERYNAVFEAGTEEIENPVPSGTQQPPPGDGTPPPS